MNRTHSRWALPAALACALLMVTQVLAGVFAPSARAADESAVDNYGACLAKEKKGDLLVLVDTSASLKSTDAAGARVKAGKYLLSQLADFADQADVELTVNVSGFANRYEPGGSWDALNPSSVDKALAKVDAFADRNTGEGTDYWLGLDGSRRDLATRAQQRPTKCQAILFFSDGTLDIDRAPDEADKPIDRPYDPENRLNSDQDRARAKERAAADMCRDGGLADQIRAGHVVILAVGLTPDEAGAQDFDLMKRVATGQGEAGPCGKIQKPPPGKFTLVSDIDDMLFEFDKYTNPGQEPRVQERKVCQGGVCPDGAHAFVLDDSITRIRILGQATIDQAQVFLVAPSGAEVELKQSQAPVKAELDGATLSYQWPSQRSFALTADRGSSKAWAGQWQVVFVDPKSDSPTGVSRTSLHLYGDLFPAWPKAEETEIRAGEPTEIILGLQRSDGTAVDPTTLLGKVSMDVSLVSDGLVKDLATGLTKDQITKPLKLDGEDLTPGSYSLRLRLNVTTADSKDGQGKAIPGTQLAPQVVDVPLEVLAPYGYPTVAESVNFGAADGEVNLSGTLSVNGPGCVWVGSQQPEILAGPEGVTELNVSSQHGRAEDCLRVEEGQTAELPVQLTSPQTGTGGLSGTFVARIAPLDAPDRAEDVEVEYRADLTRPLNTRNFVLTLILALILGPGIPLALLWLTKRANAKIPDRPLLYQEIPVQVQRDVQRDGGPLAFADGDLRQMAQIPSGGTRNLPLGGVELVAKTGASPFGEGSVQVSAPPRWVGTTEGVGASASLPLAVHNNWVLLHDPTGPADQAALLFLVAGEATPARREELLIDASRKAPDLLARIRAAAAEAGIAGPPAPPPGGGTPFGDGPGPAAPNPFGAPGDPNAFGGPGPFGGPPGSAPPSGGPTGGSPFGG
ncbi:vWA domain-containing protein [Enemella sp. A6]|uniref:vWA domain-containing protein n=1 Tax=Enemella sp. A6 TaxID=3440152 RepID=UPI003EBF73E9